MKFHFTLEELPNRALTLERSIWTGKVQLYADGEAVSRADEKGHPFLLTTPRGESVKIRVRHAFPDYSPTLRVNNRKVRLEKPLHWYEYLIGSLPMLLMLVGGLIGGGVGIGASLLNYQTIRRELPPAQKYLTVGGITFAAFFAYLALALLVETLVP